MNWSSKNEKQFKEICKISKSIESFYVDLCDLEINGKKKSDEYKKLFNNLQMAIEIEKKKYNNIIFTDVKISDWNQHISSLINIDNYLNNYDSIVVQDYNDLVYRRILCALSTNFLYKQNEIDSAFINNYKRHSINRKDIYYLSNLLNNSIENDIIRGYLYFSNQLCQKPEYKSLTKYFIQTKYFVSLINEIMEKDLINNQYEISSTLYLESEFIANIIGLETSIYKKSKADYAYGIINRSLTNLLSYEDNDYNYEYLAASALLLQCFIEAGLLISDDNLYQEFKLKYEQLIKSEEYLKHNYNNNISVHLIDECFNEYYQNNNKVYKVTMYKPK